MLTILLILYRDNKFIREFIRFSAWVIYTLPYCTIRKDWPSLSKGNQNQYSSRADSMLKLLDT